MRSHSKVDHIGNTSLESWLPPQIVKPIVFTSVSLFAPRYPSDHVIGNNSQPPALS